MGIAQCGRLDDKLLRPSYNQYANRELKTYIAEQLQFEIVWMTICSTLMTVFNKLGTYSPDKSSGLMLSVAHTRRINAAFIDSSFYCGCAAVAV